MFRPLLFILWLLAGHAFADHPGEGSEKLPDMISEALANSPGIQAKVEHLNAAKDRVQGSRSGLAPTVSAAGGRKTDGGGDSEIVGTNFAQLDAAWNLYRGGSDQSKQRIADLETEIASRELQSEKLKAAEAVAETFFELQYISESLALIEDMITQTKRGKDTARRRMATGQTTSVDALEFDILESKLRSQMAAYQTDESILSQKMHSYLDRAENKPIKVHGHLLRSSWAMNFDELEAHALSENPRIAAAKLNAERVNGDLSVLRAEFFPSVDAMGSWGKLANSSPTATKPSWSTELRVTVPLFTGLSTVKARDAKTHEKSALDLEILNVKREIQTELLEQITRMRSFEQRLVLEENSMSQADKYLKLTQSEYARGIKNSPDLASAMDLVLNAHLRNLELRREWYRARVRIQGITGKVPSA